MVGIFIVIFCSSAAAETCSQAHGEYLRGNLRGAEAILLDVLQLNTSRSEAAICWRLLGIVQFSLGKKTHALNSFEKALAFDEELSLQSTDTLDPKVVPFFERIKSRLKKPVAQEAATQAPPQAPAPEVFPPSEPDPLFAPQNPSAPPETFNDPTVFDPEPLSKSRSGDESFALPSKGRSKSASKSQSANDGDRFISVLPFGVGQFYQKRYLIGAGFAAAEVFTLYRFITITNEISSEDDKLQDYAAENCAAFQNTSAGEQQRKACVSFVEDQQTYIDNLTATKTLFMGAFAALVVVGGAEGLWHQISTENAPVKKKKKSRRKTLLFNDFKPHLKVVSSHAFEHSKARSQELLPHQNYFRNSHAGGEKYLSLALQWSITLN